ncbi:MAG: hypothetical protein N2A99_00345 [Carnobacterium alterfunditum]
MYPKFEELQKIAFDLVRAESELEKDVFLNTYEKQVNEIYDELKGVN